MHKNFLTQVSSRLKAPLPGWSAQRNMSPLKTRKYLHHPDSAKKAAVLMVLFPDKEGELNLIFIKRSTQEKDKHSGQISFPGGQMEKHDDSLQMTAFRETYEEIGIETDDLTLLGQLTPLYVYVSNFYVEPYIAFLDKKPKYKIQESEVGEVIEVKLSYLLSDASKSLTDFKIRNNVFKDMPHYILNENILWGATAMITAELLQIIEESSI